MGRDDPRWTELQSVPGLRLGDDAVTGLIDAIAAACHVLKVPRPLRPSGVLPSTAPSTNLRPYQAEGVASLLHSLMSVGGALLADDVGLGKTRQALAITQVLGGRTLVVCPAHCRLTWADEIKEVLNQEAAVATSAKKVEGWHAANYIITSYELVGKVAAVAFGQDTPTTLIMDEAHYLGGRRTLRSNSVEQLARLSTYRLALSATPLYSRPRDLYKLLRVLFGHRFGSASAFDFRYCAGRLNQWGGIDNKGISNSEELKTRLSYYMVRREKREVLTELPPLTRQVVWVEGSAKAKAAFAYAMGAEHSEKAIVNALVATLDEKMDAAVKLAADAGKFVLFTYMKKHAHELARRLRLLDVECVVITGDVPFEERVRLVDQAKKEGWGVVATIDSAGTGINNLRDVASYGIFHSIPWVPNQALQAEGRLHRMGQLGNVHWVYVGMRDSMDEVVVATCVNKLDAARALLPGSEETRALRDHLDDSKAEVSSALDAIYKAMQ